MEEGQAPQKLTRDEAKKILCKVLLMFSVELGYDTVLPIFFWGTVVSRQISITAFNILILPALWSLSMLVLVRTQSERHFNWIAFYVFLTLEAMIFLMIRVFLFGTGAFDYFNIVIFVTGAISGILGVFIYYMAGEPTIKRLSFLGFIILCNLYGFAFYTTGTSLKTLTCFILSFTLFVLFIWDAMHTIHKEGTNLISMSFIETFVMFRIGNVQ